MEQLCINLFELKGKDLQMEMDCTGDLPAQTTVRTAVVQAKHFQGKNMQG